MATTHVFLIGTLHELLVTCDWLRLVVPRENSIVVMHQVRLLCMEKTLGQIETRMETA